MVRAARNVALNRPKKREISADGIFLESARLTRGTPKLGAEWEMVAPWLAQRLLNRSLAMSSMKKFLDWSLVSMSFLAFLGVNALFIYAVGAHFGLF